MAKPRQIDYEDDANKGRIAMIRVLGSIARSHNTSNVMEVDEIAELVTEKRLAHKTIRVDGTGVDRFSPSLPFICQNISTLSEQALKETGAVPLTEQEQIHLNNVQKYRTSVESVLQAIRNPTLTLEDIAGDRLRIAYRLIRTLALIKGDVKPGQLCLTGLGNYEHVLSRWELPSPYRPGSGLYQGYRHVIEILRHLNDRPFTFTYSQGPSQPVAYTWGISYLPVPIPDHFYPDQQPQAIANYRATQQVPPNYDPTNDNALISQLFIYEQIAEHINIGTVDAKEQATLIALLNPSIARLSWPTIDEMEMYEEMILYPFILRLLAKHSYIKTTGILQERMQITYLEAKDWIETTKHFAQNTEKYQKDLERSIRMVKIDRLVDECQEDGLVTTELNAMKLQNMMLGLTTPGEDQYVDRQQALSSGLRDSIKQLEEQAKKEKAELPPAPETKGL